MILVQTPLRISFLGGGTDFGDFYRTNGGGAVLSTAINKYVFVLVKERFDNLIYVNYSRKEIVDSVDAVQHDLVREAMKITGVGQGVEITTLADIPAEGTGLGSSSSTTVGLLQALYCYKGENKPAEALAKEACAVEIERLGRPIGKQDQYIAAYGNMQFISFSSNDFIHLEKLVLNDRDRRRLEQNLMLFYTGISRQSGTILTEQKANINGNHGTRERLEELKKLAGDARETLVAGDLDQFGAILHRGWECKRQLAKGITNGEIDELYEVARKAGAIGGKITGAGGGGFLLLYCPLPAQESVRQALAHLRELPFHFERDGSKVILNYRKS